MTLSYQVFEGDVSLMATPRAGFLECVEVEIVDGNYRVTSVAEDASPHWIGIGAARQAALLDYLKKRMGFYEEGEKA